jgi:uncharacterized membrane protein YgdD (TMEM256/DUF423 family)
MKTNNWIIIGALIMAIGVAFGAIGAHALKDLLNDYQLTLWNKGVFYQLIHGLGLLLISLLSLNNSAFRLKWVLRLMLVGIVFFSGSLYTIAINNGVLGEVLFVKYLMIPITPIGGSLLVISWLLLALKLK